MDLSQDRKLIWECKPVLRLVYNDFHDRIAALCQTGLTIEIGGGIGNLKQRLPDLIASDIQFSSGLDLVADAQNLPFGSNLASNFVMVDVLHDLEFPAAFFSEAQRVLRSGGRIIMVEPAITLVSTLFYRLLHHEPVMTSADPLTTGRPNPDRDPHAANQAIPTLIATRYRERFHELFPSLRIARVDWFSLAAYPMSGGFKPWSLLSVGSARRLLRLERALEPILGRFAGFRVLLMLEKNVLEHSHSADAIQRMALRN